MIKKYLGSILNLKNDLQRNIFSLSYKYTYTHIDSLALDRMLGTVKC